MVAIRRQLTAPDTEATDEVAYGPESTPAIRSAPTGALPETLDCSAMDQTDAQGRSPVSKWSVWLGTLPIQLTLASILLISVESISFRLL